MKKHIPILLLLVLLVCWGFFFNHVSTQFIFSPTNYEQPILPGLKEVSIPVQFGHALNGLYLAPKAGKPVILFFHGKSLNVSFFQDFAQQYAKYGYGVLLFDYRGYGKTPGTPTEKNMYEDGESALRYLLINKDVSARDIILWGFSLGCAVALETVNNHPDVNFRAVVLQSPFTNTPEMAYYILMRCYHPDYFGLKLTSAILHPALANKSFDNTRKIASVHTPLFIGMSKADRTVPWRMSIHLAQMAPQHAQLFSSLAGTHNDMRWMEQEAVRFLQQQDELAQQIDGN